MSPQSENKIILVTRPTRLDELVRRFNTVEQARFYVEHLGADFSDYQREHETYQEARRASQDVLSRLGRVQAVDRGFVPNFLFGPRDIVVVLGQDGLVANTLKYLAGQPVLGVNPDPKRWDGQLLPFQVKDLARVMPEVFLKKRPLRAVTMAEARLNNGQVLRAVNDLFVGPKSHGSARYRLEIGGAQERHSSSGVIISTGLGSTGWFKSLITGAQAVAAAASRVLGTAGALPPPPATTSVPAPHVPAAIPWDVRHLYFTVREPFPTTSTGATLVFGKVTAQQPLHIISEMAENGVIFSDGVEKDFLEFNSGTRALITLAGQQGCLVI